MDTYKYMKGSFGTGHLQSTRTFVALGRVPHAKNKEECAYHRETVACCTLLHLSYPLWCFNEDARFYISWVDRRRKQIRRVNRSLPADFFV